MPRICDRDECERPHRAKGLCAMHYRHEYGRHDKVAEFPCGYCGVTLLKQIRADRTQRFCSADCMAAAHGGRLSCSVPTSHPARWIGDKVAVVHSTCNRCNVPTVSSSWSPRRYCSDRCSRRAQWSREGKRTQWARQKRNRLTREKRTREAIFDRDGYVCWLCRTPTNPSLPYLDDLYPTVDHVVPQSHGGGDAPDNLRTAHRVCTSIRQDRVEVTSLPSPLER